MYRIFSYALKFLSAISLPIAIAEGYGAMVNGQAQLIIAGTAYLGLLDSGMTITAINSGGGEKKEFGGKNYPRILTNQNKATIRVVVIGSIVTALLIVICHRNNILSTPVSYGALTLSLTAVIEIALTPYKYLLYSEGKARTAEKREAYLCTGGAFLLVIWSLLIYTDKIPETIGLVIGFLLLRGDRVISGLVSFLEFRKIVLRDSRLDSPRNSTHRELEDAICSNSRTNDRVWITLLQIFALLNWSADTFLVRFFVGLRAVSDYSIYYKFFMVPSTLALIASPVIQSAVYTDILSRSKFSTLFKLSLPFIFTVSSCLLGATIALINVHPRIYPALGLTSEPTISLLASFSIMSGLSVVAGVYAPIANGLRIFKYQAALSALFLPMNVLLSWFFTQELSLGIAGVVTATNITMAVTSCTLVPLRIMAGFKKV